MCLFYNLRSAEIVKDSLIFQYHADETEYMQFNKYESSQSLRL